MPQSLLNHIPQEISMKKITALGVVTLFAVCATADVIYISTFEELCLIGNHENYPLNGDYELTNHIDASPSKNMNNGKGFKPIGFVRYQSDNGFSGRFDGNGFKIKNLYINDSSGGSGGLFDVLTGFASIKNVGLEDVYISGDQDVGGLVGYMEKDNIIRQCYTTGIVIAKRGNVGGLVGDNDGDIFDSYSAASIKGRGALPIGGLVGRLWGAIYNSYSIGVVLRNLDMPDVIWPGEGLNDCRAGSLGGPTFSSYWDYETSSTTTSKGGEGKTTEEMMRKATFVDWDFETIWQIDEGKDYPKLRIFESKGSSVISAPRIVSGNRVVKIRNGLNLNVKNSAKVEIFDLKGKLVYKRNLADGVHSVSLARLPKGIYLARAAFGRERVDLRLQVR